MNSLKLTASVLFAALFVATAATAQIQVPACSAPAADSGPIQSAWLPPCAPTAEVRFNFTHAALELEHGVTIDFADYTERAPGALQGYVYIRVAGDWMLMPYYALPGSRKQIAIN
jgi:hypothetical protein